MRPIWRWWIFCAANALDVRYGWRWARATWAWAVRGFDMGDPITDYGDDAEAPF